MFKTLAITLGLLATWSVRAADPHPGAGDVKVITDVSYGPHGVRNLMDIYVPAAEAKAPRPLVVIIHGGGWAGGDKKSHAYMGDALARKGFVAASITYRFAPANRAPAQMDDAQRAVRWLRHHAKEYNLDPERVGAIGASAGGHLTSYIALAETRDNSDAELAKYSSKVQCAVDCYGPVDLVGMMKSASAPIVEGFLCKPLAGNEEAYRAASATSQVKQNPPPFLIVHGTKDVGEKRGQVPIEQSIDFAEQLKKAGGDVTLLKLEGAGHGFTGGGRNKYAVQTLEAAAEFFAKHLKKD
jgi:acetyl esterase/lipase